MCVCIYIYIYILHIHTCIYIDCVVLPTRSNALLILLLNLTNLTTKLATNLTTKLATNLTTKLAKINLANLTTQLAIARLGTTAKTPPKL